MPRAFAQSPPARSAGLPSPIRMSPAPRSYPSSPPLLLGRSLPRLPDTRQLRDKIQYRAMAGQAIHFGTSGWRGIIAEDFAFSGVRRASEAIASHLGAGAKSI